MSAAAPTERSVVDITVTRTATLFDAEGKPALELESKDGGVKITLLPRNGSRRQPVPIADLRHALNEMEKAT